MPTLPAPKLHIAISGGGLAGAVLANALFPLPHLKIHIYESAPKFSERGAAVGLAVNAQVALQHALSGGEADSEAATRAEGIMRRAGAVNMSSSRLIIGSGPQAQTRILDIASEHQGRVVHRASLLRELLAPLPAEVLSAGKKLVSIKTAGSGPVKLQFQDGTEDEVDALIGADGIFSMVREFILGDVGLASKPIRAGWWDARNLAPIERAREVLGPEMFEERELRQYGWVGNGGFMMHDVLDEGKTVQCVVSGIEGRSDWQGEDRKKKLSKETLEMAFAEWMGGPTAKGMIELLLDQESPCAYSQWEHKNAPTYAEGRVCIMGDAAHAMTPWQGSGASQAIEDAMILRTLLAAIHRPEHIDAALKVYDQIRRPRSQQIAESSRITGQILTGQDEGVGLEAERLRKALVKRWDFIYAFDPKKHQEEALEALRLMNQQ